MNIECNNSCYNNSCFNNDRPNSSGKTKIFIGVILILGLAIGLGVYFGVYYEKDFENQGIFYLSFIKIKNDLSILAYLIFRSSETTTRQTPLRGCLFNFFFQSQRIGMKLWPINFEIWPIFGILDILWPLVTSQPFFSRIWRHERHFDIQFT